MQQNVEGNTGIDISKAMKKKPYSVNQISSTSNFLINTFFWIYSIICIIPLILVFSVSFSEETAVRIHGYSFWPRGFSLEAYTFLLEDMTQIATSYGITIFITVVGTVVGVVLMALYAYPISRTDFPHRNFFTFFIFFTMLFNGGLIPFYLTYVNLLGLKNNLLALIIPLLISAFFVLIMRTFFMNTIPKALIESAKIDGAGEIRIFWKIILPLSLPVIASVALFSTLNYWNDWFLALLYIDNRHTHLMPIQFLMYRTMLDVQFLASNATAAAAIAAAGGVLSFPTETIRMAMAVVGIGPIIFAYPFFQKYFIKGLTVGAVKG